jgi:hypothetical protein
MVPDFLSSKFSDSNAGQLDALSGRLYYRIFVKDVWSGVVSLDHLLCEHLVLGAPLCDP